MPNISSNPYALIMKTFKHALSLIFHRNRFEKPARITKANVRGFLQGNLRAFGSKISFLKPPAHIEEQAYWRITLIKERSPICIQQGQCKVCGCSTDEIVFEDRSCKGDCYPPMMNADTWAQYKTTHN